MAGFLYFMVYFILGILYILKCLWGVFMEIVSWNVNGLPSFVESQSYKPIEAINPDVFCIQEIRTQEKIKVLEGYYQFWNPGKRNGFLVRLP